MSKFKPGTVEKNLSSTRDPPVGFYLPLCDVGVCDALTTEIQR